MLLHSDTQTLDIYVEQNKYSFQKNWNSDFLSKTEFWNQLAPFLNSSGLYLLKRDEQLGIQIYLKILSMKVLDVRIERMIFIRCLLFLRPGLFWIIYTQPFMSSPMLRGRC